MADKQQNKQSFGPAFDDVEVDESEADVDAEAFIAVLLVVSLAVAFITLITFGVWVLFHAK